MRDAVVNLTVCARLWVRGVEFGLEVKASRSRRRSETETETATQP